MSPMKKIEWVIAGFPTIGEAEKQLEDMIQWARTTFYTDDWNVQSSVGQRVDGFYASIIGTKEDRTNELT